MPHNLFLKSESNIFWEKEPNRCKSSNGFEHLGSAHLHVTLTLRSASPAAPVFTRKNDWRLTATWRSPSPWTVTRLVSMTATLMGVSARTHIVTLTQAHSQRTKLKQDISFHYNFLQYFQLWSMHPTSFCSNTYIWTQNCNSTTLK